MSWDQDDALRDAILADIRAQIPEEMQPGDVTVHMVADTLDISEPRALYYLKKMERDGRLISLRAHVPGARVPMKVWRKAP